MKRVLISLAGALAMTTLAAPALADVIDGVWCFNDGRSLAIDGPSIITPGGNKIAGDYTRHSFFYTVPASEPNAGSVITMLLVNETTVNLWVGAAQQAGVAQVWRRCQPVA
jgi:hypothetical protein